MSKIGLSERDDFFSIIFKLYYYVISVKLIKQIFKMFFFHVKIILLIIINHLLKKL